MRLTQSRLRLMAALAIGGGAALALALPAGAAVADASQDPSAQVLSLGNEAIVDARGAVVFASVQVACPAGWQVMAPLQVTVTENVGGGNLASGTTRVDPGPCDGTVHEVTVTILPTQAPFKKGVAFGQATVGISNGLSGQMLTDQHNIQIAKK